MGAGLPEATTTQLILRGPVPPRIAVGTSVTTLTVTVFFAALIHALGGEPPWHVVIWSCPGALTGAQFGARLQAKLPPNVSQRVLAVVFATVGVLVIVLRDVGVGGPRPLTPPAILSLVPTPTPPGRPHARLR